MILSRLLHAAFFLPVVLADITFTSPSAGASITGTSLSITWTNTGSPVLTSYSLFLCAGGNSADNFIQLATLADNGNPSTGKLTATIQPGVGGTGTNAYFLKMIGAATGGTIITYSSRFSLPSMTGTFTPQVQAGLKTVSGTSGPANQNQVAQINNNGVSAVAGTGSYAVAYTLQTGPIRYAPMPPVPGSVITAKNPSAQFPTSSYSVYTTYAGSPNAATTNTAAVAFATTSMENTVGAAALPTDAAMQKFLNRWKD